MAQRFSYYPDCGFKRTHSNTVFVSILKRVKGWKGCAGGWWNNGLQLRKDPKLHIHKWVTSSEHRFTSASVCPGQSWARLNPTSFCFINIIIASLPLFDPWACICQRKEFCFYTLFYVTLFLWVYLHTGSWLVLLNYDVANLSSEIFSFFFPAYLDSLYQR